MFARHYNTGMRATLAAGLAVLFWASPPSARAQSPVAPRIADLPVQQWLAEGEREEIPWKVRVYSAGLSFEQRLLVGMAVEVTGKSLARRGISNDLLLFVRLTDSVGRTFQDFGKVPLSEDAQVPRKTVLEFSWGAFVLAGDYRAAVILYDRGTQLRSVATRAVHVPPLHADPLPDSWRHLPTVEFLRPTEGLDLEFHPEIESRLWLPVTSPRPVEVELLVNFGLPETSVRFRSARAAIHWALLATFKALAQLRVPGDALRITAFDLARRKVLFEQERAAQLDWPRLRDVLTANSASVVPVQELQERKKSAAFLRQFLSQRLAGPESDGAPREAPTSTPPLRVFILLSSMMLFEPGSDLAPMAPSGNCNCRIYYVQYQHSPWLVFDDVAHVLKPLHPRIFHVSDAHGVRKAIAAILEEISHF